MVTDVQTASPDDSLVAKRDPNAKHLVYLIEQESNENLYTITMDSVVKALDFCPDRYWLLIITDEKIVVFDLEHKYTLAELTNTYNDEVYWSPPVLGADSDSCFRYDLAHNNQIIWTGNVIDWLYHSTRASGEDSEDSDDSTDLETMDQVIQAVSDITI